MTLRPLACLAAACLALIACAPVPQAAPAPLPPGSPEAKALMPLGSRWDVLALNGKGLKAGAVSLGILGPAPDPQTVGDNSAAFTGCNSYSGIPFPPLGLPGEATGPVSTLIGCPDDLAALDEGMLAALGATDSIGPGARPGTVDLIAGGERVMTVQPKASTD